MTDSGTAPQWRTTSPADGPRIPRRRPLPQEYLDASGEELAARIADARRRLGDRLLVLGHYYQRDDVITYADFVGDSLQLARNAAQRPDADYIVFCGVHFMAETADILSTPDQAVTLPNLDAGCLMADMADIDQVEACWRSLEEICGTAPDADGRQQIVPVTYVNSSAALKAFCGRHGGIVCTSSNARAVLDWALARGRRVLFFPDQHLGRNTGRAMGIPTERMALWDPAEPQGGRPAADYAEATLILWQGCCPVHQRFTVAQVEQARREHPQVKVLVHPECSSAVVDAADGVGSTSYIVSSIEQAPAGSVFAVGTEATLVRRLARQHPDRTVFCLEPDAGPCPTMALVDPAHLAWTLESLERGDVVNRVRVDADIAGDARVALRRMLEMRP